MAVQQWSTIVSEVLQDMWTRVLNFIPDLIGALLILIIGWIIADLVAWAIDRVLRLVRLPDLFKTARVEDLLKRANSKLDMTGLIASFIKWIILLVSFIAAADVMKLETIRVFLNNILAYIPNVVAAGAILLIGAIFADFISSVIKGAISAANLAFVELVGSAAKYAILVFAILAALNQLNIAEPFLQSLFIGFVAFLAIAGGLAFGLGGQGVAKDLLEQLRKELKG